MFKQILNNFRKFDIYKFLIYAAIVAVIPYYNLSGTPAMALGAIALGIAMISSVEFCALCVAYSIPFAIGVQEVFGAVNLNNAIQLVFVLKAIIDGKGLLSVNKVIQIFAIALATQLLPMIACYQNIMNVIILSINILLLVIYYKLVRGRRLPYITTFVAFSLGVLISCFVALYGSFEIRNSEYLEYDFFRFCGLWTDPNFLGAFCTIALATCLHLSQGKTKNLLLLSPIMMLTLFFGFKTLSFTYIVLLVVVIGVFVMSHSKNTGQLFLLGLICVIVVAPYIVEKIDNVMSVRIVGDDSDVSHGRFTSSLDLLSIWFSNIQYFLFGYGYMNTLGAIKDLVGHHAVSHNTYVDIITELGFFLNVVLWGSAVRKGYISRKYLKPLFSQLGIIIFVTLLTLGTVSGLKYEFVFIFIACYIAQVENEYNIMHK